MKFGFVAKHRGAWSPRPSKARAGAVGIAVATAGRPSEMFEELLA